MNYNELNTTQKAMTTRLLNAKKALNKAQEAYDREVAKSIETLKACGNIRKDTALISYTPSSTSISLDTVKLRNADAELYGKLLAEYKRETNRKETLRVVL